MVPSRIMFSQFTPSAGTQIWDGVKSGDLGGVLGDGGENDATSQSSAHFVSVQSQISKVRTLRGWALTQSLSLRAFVSFD